MSRIWKSMIAKFSNPMFLKKWLASLYPMPFILLANQPLNSFSYSKPLIIR